MKWITHFWRALVTAAVVHVAAAFSRTVQPISYSYRTANDDGESESVVHYGRLQHAAGAYGSEDEALARPLSTHPSVLAHHYYDPTTEAAYSSWLREKKVTIPAAAAIAAPSPPVSTTTTTATTTKAKKSRKKNDYVPRVSYVRKAPTGSGAATPRAGQRPSTTTQSIIVPSVRLRQKGRWLKVRNEIPVKESLQHGVEPPAAPEIDEPRLKVEPVDDRTRMDDVNKFGSATGAGSARRLAGSASRFTADASKSDGQLQRRRQRFGSKVVAASSAAGNRSSSAHSEVVEHDAAAAAGRGAWNDHHHSTTTTDDPAASRLRGASGRFAPVAERLQSSHPRDNLGQRTTETYTAEKEYDYAAAPETTVGLKYTPASTTVDHRLPLVSPRNAIDVQKSNVSGKTTPMPKYKEAYLRKSHSRVTTATANPFEPSRNVAQLADASNDRYETETIKYNEELPTSTAADQPNSNSDAEPLNPSDAADGEVAIEPGTHHESLKYSDTEKTEEIFHDTEYPDEEEETEADEELKDSPTDESPSKILQKPIRFAYSSDQNISESQHEHKEPETKEKEGGGEKHKSAHHKSEGDKAEEDYESAVEYDKGTNGHSDKENRNQHHEEEGGKKNKHHDESGHHASHHVAAKGEKATVFGESGNHKKGHSTKGSHNIHKKNEYLKKHEFYDEHHEDDEHKNYGDFHKGHKYKKGNHYKKKHRDGEYSEGHSGKMGKKHHGHRFRQHKGHDDAFKHVDHYGNSEDYGEKGHHSEGKKWKYEML